MYNVYNNIIGYDDNNCCFDDNKSVRERYITMVDYIV